MHHTLNSLIAIREKSATKEKLAELKALNTPTLRDVLFAAFSPTVLTGIEKLDYTPLPFMTALGTPAADAPTLAEFLILLDSLTTRKIVGNLAKATACAFVERFPEPYAEMVAQIFTQKLRVGLQAKQINKVLGDLIPVFGVQLAEKFETDRIPFPAWVSAKLDGMRCLAFVRSGSVNLLSRSGKPIDGCPHITAQLKKAKDGIYDGELMHPAGFQLTLSFCRAKVAKPGHEAVNYHIFDYVPFDEWDKEELAAKERFSQLGAELSRISQPNLLLVVHTLVYNSLDILTSHREFNRLGYEGTMIQWLGGYVRKRGWHLMKLKDLVETSGSIIGYELGTENSTKGLINAFWVQDDKTHRKFKFTSGINDEMRSGDPDRFVGKHLELKYQELTDLNEDGSGGVPRFARFYRWREDLD